MRLDKFLSEMATESRSELKKMIKKGLVKVNGEIIKDPSVHIDENSDEISLNGKFIEYKKFVYYMLNKPQGVVSATKDNLHKTVIDLLNDEDKKKGIFPVGRLDIDTEGLLILTNDGEFSHNLLAPNKHVSKKYYARVEGILVSDAVEQCKKGIDIGTEEEPEVCKSAELEIISVDDGESTTEIYLTISEGKFHQVKRMIKKLGGEVVYLKRLSMGKYELDENLKLGDYKRLDI
ncbi:pseudouridine synthase [Eubacterium sp.]|uniref:pseudouridine synthase n=1 Tax=Eubacterium sp. TaxID=142586 RepID=UPI0025FA401E|nr:pseudouridine synthase [Eubacterium sp.]MCR5628655.1 rRNA pseudouridine synthase [Eubacterium sp.]